MTNILRKQTSPATALLLGATALFGSLHAEAASLAISQVPLYLGGTVEPNVMFVLDDSGSMAWSFMPDDIYGYYNTKRAKSSAFNSVYYNPNVTYSPPLDENGDPESNATFTAAWWDGYSTSRQLNTVNLSTSFRPTWYYPGYSTQYSDNTAQAAYYYVFDGTNSGCNGTTNDDDCYDKIVVSSTSGPGGTDERTNFANWYSYYRNRLYAAKAGITRAFGIQGTGMRVGYGRINKGTASIDGVSTTTLERGVRDFSDVDIYGNTTNYRKDFFDWLYATDYTGSTPLRRALDAAGQYFERSDSKGPASTTPGTSGGNDLSCRQNYTILTTDGYWTSGSSYEAATAAARNNNDNTDGTAYTDVNGNTGQFLGVAPFADSYSNTLADIAAYYWKRDLRTDLPNDVPVNSDDPAFWQHMVTFGVGLGVEGNISPSAAFAAISTQTDPGWADPFATNPAKIDDLLHSAVNSRGEFFSAKDPQTFASALASTLATINARTSSAASVSTNSTYLSTDTLVYQALFNSDGWTGDVLAYEIEEKTNNNGVTYYTTKASPEWKATDNVPAHGSRSLYTWDVNTSSAISFRWASLNTTQQGALGSSNLLDFIRGDNSKEQANGGSYRDRNDVIGDVVNSSPAFIGKQNYGYAQAASLTDTERNAYRTRRSTNTTYVNRDPALAFGANDGIFHVVDATTGSELFGFIPNSIIPNLPDLADPDYTHRYFVDGSPVTTDALIGGAWTSVLVGSTGAGGKAYFAIDVEDVSSFSANDILWEVSNATTGFSELGYTIGQAAIGRTENGKWVAIIGNGYNSTSQTARLFVIDLATGALLKEIDTQAGSTSTPNGLASPIAVDANRNGSIDLVYAADLLGNVWKFDFTDDNSASNNWKLAFTGKPLFKAEYTSGGNTITQPITTRPQVGLHPDGGLMVYFGTGKYFETGDNTDLSLQSLYGVRDECGLATGSCSASGTSKVSRSNLLQQEIVFEGSHSFNGNSWEVREFSQNPDNGEPGFYVDLVYSSNYEGERVLSTPILWSDRVIYVTAIPDNDSCNGGGESWIIELSPKTGGRTDFNPFDLAKDGTYGANSQITKGTAINARKVKGGMIGGLGQMQAKDGKRLKIGSTSSASFDSSLQEGEGSRRISWRQLQ